EAGFAGETDAEDVGGIAGGAADDCGNPNQEADDAERHGQLHEGPGNGGPELAAELDLLVGVCAELFWNFRGATSLLAGGNQLANELRKVFAGVREGVGE